MLTPDGRFAASQLTRVYDRDPTLFLGESANLLDPEQLDRYGWFPYGDIPAGSDSKRLLQEADPNDVANLAPSEKDAIEGPEAGAYVGIPSAVAATGAVIGGLGLLAKFISEFFAP
ncbi:MAG: hypothetical protein JSW67_04830 [Candidatus Latescibacterota bacterium]|nr:MAG: hypothetical protein JSW67_04830 [Candidatus Latescibacterota bacterium]